MKSDIEEQKSKTRSENIASNIESNQKKIKNGKEETLKDMLKEVDDEVKREEIIHMLLEQKVSKVIKEEEEEKRKFSYKVSNFAGSNRFILFVIIFVLVWIVIDVFFFLKGQFNPYSFVIMNAILSFIMLIFCSIIIFNQNKKKKIDEKKSENDYKVNLKNEIIIEDMHYKLDDLIEKQDEIVKRVQELEKRRKVPPIKEKKEYKFIDISEKDRNKH
ncbi:DUF1003 domain-containing protein [Leptotrichia hongkongensis]|uniref:DUF1003 domain-containing protein n=1 Tax=Leptotrichia hongkongensis TaxID=554406 RepID=A0ABV4S2S9_9FUSO|nr:DUF1003 domain-containing protein [uncultured Leptotrichia sp.]MDO4638628.1 DUF1003 domain-containing protein [Leptotrichia hongkongensis]